MKLYIAQHLARILIYKKQVIRFLESYKAPAFKNNSLLDAFTKTRIFQLKKTKISYTVQPHPNSKASELNSLIFFLNIKIKDLIPIPSSIKRNFQAVSKVIKIEGLKTVLVRMERSMSLLFELQACYLVSRKMFL